MCSVVVMAWHQLSVALSVNYITFYFIFILLIIIHVYLYIFLLNIIYFF